MSKEEPDAVTAPTSTENNSEESGSINTTPGVDAAKVLMNAANSPSETRKAMVLAVLAGMIVGGTAEVAGPAGLAGVIAAALGADGLNRMSPYMTEEVRDYPWFFAAGAIVGWVAVTAGEMYGMTGV